MMFSQRAQNIAPFLAMEYSEKAMKLEKQGRRVVRLNIGEPDFGAPQVVRQALSKAIGHQDFAYCSALGIAELRQKIANFYYDYHGISIDANRVVITAGASAALLLICAALVNPGDEVIIGDPAYPCNRQFIYHYGGKVRLLPTSPKDNFQLTSNCIANAWDRNCKGVLLASPSNPTGTGIIPEEMTKITDFCKKQNAWRIIDEIYLNIQLQDNAPLQTVLAHDNNAIVVNSFSKFFGMTGWRLGWCVVPESMVSTMEKLAQNLFICPSTPAQYAALSCFSKEALQECEDRRTLLKKRLKLVQSVLNNSPLSIDVQPHGAFYCYVNISQTGLSAIEFCDQLLELEGVALTPGNDFGQHNASHYVRLSFATDTQLLQEGLQKMTRFVNNLVV